MKSYLTYLIPVAAIVLLLAGIECTPAQLETAPNLTLPSASEVGNVVGNTGDVTPIYENQFVRNVTGWDIAINKENLSGQGTVNTGEQLQQLKSSIGSVRNWMGLTILKNQGCEQIAVNLFTSEVTAKLGNSTVVGDTKSNVYNICGPEVKNHEMSAALSEYTGWTDYKIISNDTKIMIHQNGFWFYCRVEHRATIDKVSKKNIEDLNKFLRQSKVDTLTF